MEPNEISMLLMGFKATAEIIKSILSMSGNNVKLNEKVIELQGIILSLQSGYSELVSKYSELVKIKSNLETKLMEYENWDKTKSQYELKETAPGVFVYISKKYDKSSEPEHWLCTNCFKDRKISILQKHKTSRFDYYCPNCKIDICIPTQKRKFPYYSFDKA